MNWKYGKLGSQQLKILLFSWEQQTEVLRPQLVSEKSDFQITWTFRSLDLSKPQKISPTSHHDDLFSIGKGVSNRVMSSDFPSANTASSLTEAAFSRLQPVVASIANSAASSSNWELPCSSFSCCSPSDMLFDWGVPGRQGSSDMANL